MTDTSHTDLLDETPGIRISDLVEYIQQIDTTGQEIAGTFTMGGLLLDLAIVREAGVIRIVVEDQDIDLEPLASNLIDGITGRWYFHCPQCDRRCTALYRPSTEESFACRKCHHLEYRSRVQNNRPLFEAVGAMSGLDWRVVKAAYQSITPNQQNNRRTES